MVLCVVDLLGIMLIWGACKQRNFFRAFKDFACWSICTINRRCSNAFTHVYPRFKVSVSDLFWFIWGWAKARGLLALPSKPLKPTDDVIFCLSLVLLRGFFLFRSKKIRHSALIERGTSRIALFSTLIFLKIGQKKTLRILNFSSFCTSLHESISDTWISQFRSVLVKLDRHSVSPNRFVL